MIKQDYSYDDDLEVTDEPKRLLENGPGIFYAALVCIVSGFLFAVAVFG